MNMKSAFMSAISVLMIGGSIYATSVVTMGENAAAQNSSAKTIVDDAIAKGIVGETAAGYLALTSGSTSREVLNAMNEINAGRKQAYTELARDRATSIDIVAALRGEKQLANAERGSMIMTQQGQWIKVR